MRRPLPCGSWTSPLGIAATAGAQLRYQQPRIAGGACWWLESRPLEQGRVALMRSRDGVLQDLLPAPFSVRSRVHEYGGGAYAVAGDAVYFCNDTDQSIY